MSFYNDCCLIDDTVHLLQASDPEGVTDVPLRVVNNYFSVGADAQIALEFHTERGKYAQMYKCTCVGP